MTTNHQKMEVNFQNIVYNATKKSAYFTRLKMKIFFCVMNKQLCDVYSYIKFHS
jgi:hypothetical protein